MCGLHFFLFLHFGIAGLFPGNVQYAWQIKTIKKRLKQMTKNEEKRKEKETSAVVAVTIQLAK